MEAASRTIALLKSDTLDSFPLTVKREGRRLICPCSSRRRKALYRSTEDLVGMV